MGTLDGARWKGIMISRATFPNVVFYFTFSKEPGHGLWSMGEEWTCSLLG